MNRIHCIILLALSSISLLSSAQTTDTSRIERASRAFAHQEWASAEALYSTLIDQNPTHTPFYGHAIVASGMMADTLTQQHLTTRALDERIPIDSLFASVEQISLSLGQTSLYEHYLLSTQTHNQWLSRIIEAALMRYYTYRRYPQGMIQYSLIMLEGNPDNIDFLYTLAQGYLLNGQTTEAIDTYKKIVTLRPDSLQALLYLANYYRTLSQSDAIAAQQADNYFRQAQAIHPTPYIEQALR